ncbi:hypothetical protein H6P81_004211 [Aristolochia fimbriata]|uniref:Uncharacterized protein n=1 Tax=Aristolochia fimbriata TaxID=158543 RepID=A0AAV7FFJ3_ARIFI|nr:hypothetical protein H6P81_004211 [Aristolochia fimbriata]
MRHADSTISDDESVDCVDDAALRVDFTMDRAYTMYVPLEKVKFMVLGANQSSKVFFRFLSSPNFCGAAAASLTLKIVSDAC